MLIHRVTVVPTGNSIIPLTLQRYFAQTIDLEALCEFIREGIDEFSAIPVDDFDAWVKAESRFGRKEALPKALAVVQKTSQEDVDRYVKYAKCGNRSQICVPQMGFINLETHETVHRQSAEPIHEFFELSYAQYLTIPRSVLQSMPAEWQARFVQCLNELDATIDWRPKRGCYRVELRYREYGIHPAFDTWGQPIDDPLADYERGRRRIPHR